MSFKHLATTLSFSLYLTGILLSAGLFAYMVYQSGWSRVLALKGDEKAAYKLLLPGYRPIFRALAFSYFLLFTYLTSLLICSYEKSNPAKSDGCNILRPIFLCNLSISWIFIKLFS